MAKMLMIAAGCEDCDDVDALRTDPASKIAIGRCLVTGADLMSQLTLSRLENLPDWRTLARIGLGHIDLYRRGFARRPRRIVLDIDATDDPVHRYDCTCFQPIHIFGGVSGKPGLSLLRPASGLRARRWRRSCATLSAASASTGPTWRSSCGDSHYWSEPALALLEALACDYIIGLAITPGSPRSQRAGASNARSAVRG